MGDTAAAWFTSVVDAFKSVSIDGPIRLKTFLPNENSRRADSRYFPGYALQLDGTAPETSLTDGFPILITCTASLDDLNRRIEAGGGQGERCSDHLFLSQPFYAAFLLDWYKCHLLTLPTLTQRDSQRSRCQDFAPTLLSPRQYHTARILGGLFA